MSEQKQTTVGAAVAAWGSSVEFVEELYQATEGEVDVGTELAEKNAETLGALALEKLVRYFRFQEDADLALDRELERISEARARVASRKEWASNKIMVIAGDRKKVTVGSFLVKQKLGSERVEASPSLDLDKLPEELVRVTPEKTVVNPEKRALDKAKAKAWIKDSDNLPISGVSIVRGPTTIDIQ